MFTRKCPNESIPNEFYHGRMTIGSKMVSSFCFQIDNHNRLKCSRHVAFKPKFTQFSDGTGYVEDGREIFDEEEADTEYEGAKKRDKDKKKGNKKRLRDVNKPVEGNASIQSMFGNVVAKKKEPKLKLDEDDILAGILGEIDPNDTKVNGKASGTAETSTTSDASVATSKIKEKTEMAMVKDYIANFSKSLPRKKDVKAESISDDVSVCHFHIFFVKILNI